MPTLDRGPFGYPTLTGEVRRGIVAGFEGEETPPVRREAGDRVEAGEPEAGVPVPDGVTLSVELSLES